MWKRVLHIYNIAFDLYWLNMHLPFMGKHCITLPSDRDLDGVLRHRQPYLSFTDEEEAMGKEAMRKMGIPDDAPFICFHNRDNTYLNTMYPKAEWRYHDYRDSDIHNYLPAMEEMTKRGYYALRMGAVVKEKLITDNAQIIDYATRFRTDFMDIYLSAKCRFFIASAVGINAIPMIFRRPVLCVNYIPLEYLLSWKSNCITIFKYLWMKNHNRFMTFREIIESGVGRILYTEDYEKKGLTPVENTPEEITFAVIEMDDMLNGNYQALEGDEELQISFWSLFKESDLNHIFVSRIGAHYILQNKGLLL